MVVAENPNLEAPNMSRSRLQTARSATMIIGVICGAASVGILLRLAPGPGWEMKVLGLTYLVTALFCAFALSQLYPKGELIRPMAVVSILFGLSQVASAAFLSGMGLPSAIVFLVYAMVISSSAMDERSANATVLHGLVTAGACALLSEFSPFPQYTSDLVRIYTPAMLGILFMVYVVLLAMQFIATTLRIRLVTAFIAIVIIPLSILSFAQSRFTYKVLQDETNESLQLAALQTANGLDSFLERTRNSVIEASKFDIFVRYLALPPEERIGSPEENEMRMTLKILDTDELSDTVYLASYGVLDMNGMNIYDTLSERVTEHLTSEAERGLSGVNIDTVTKGKGSNESEEEYFLIPARTGTDYASPLHIEDRLKSFFYMSAPIKTPQGEVVGVLRVRYDGLLLQQLMRGYNGLLGNKSYVMLVDENNVRLADTLNPNYLYKSIAPITGSKLQTLQANKRIPDLPESMISTNMIDFDQALKNSDQSPFFATEVSTRPLDQADNLPEIGAVVPLRMMPWKVVYLLEDFNDLEVRKGQRGIATLLTTVIAGLVGIVAVGVSQVLSNPIITLTEAAKRISQGDLQAQVDVHSSDEFGMLGNTFNIMTNQLRTLINELEDRVKARTQEIEITE